MSRKRINEESRPAALSEGDRGLIEKFRQISTAIESQEHHVRGARQRLTEEVKKLRALLAELRDLARPLPLLDGAGN